MASVPPSRRTVTRGLSLAGIPARPSLRLGVATWPASSTGTSVKSERRSTIWPVLIRRHNPLDKPRLCAIRYDIN